MLYGQSAKAQLWACVNQSGYVNDPGIQHHHNGVDYCLEVAEGKAYAGAEVRWWKWYVDSIVKLAHAAIDFSTNKPLLARVPISNGTPAQKWIWTKSVEGYLLNSALNRQLCLDPEGASSGDRNGQRLQLWNCERTNWKSAQEFATLDLGRTNGLFDMRRECHAQSSPREVCTISCNYRNKWKPFWYDGITYSCGHPNGPNRSPVCVTNIHPDQEPHDWEPEGEPLCSCECSPRGGGPDSAAGSNRTRTRKIALTGSAGLATKAATKAAATKAAAAATPTL
ncbi:hypothetical protein H9P43_005483 [Blastocladiella emersonii ATCC 22665]|nr:hypothetical protein H9P43_005483 [Blastocladiella emersonii ATCC 22665]